MDHKKIDILFQEKLKNVKVSPNNKVWNSIETKLKRKKRKLFPFSWLYGSVAALLVLGLLLYPFAKKEVIVTKKTNEIVTKTPEEEFLDIKKDNSKKEIFTTEKSDVTNSILANRDNDIITKKESHLNKIEGDIVEIKRGLVKTLQLNQPNIQSNLSPIIVDNVIDNFKIYLRETKKKTIDFNVAINTIKKDSKQKSLKNWSVATSFAVLQSNSFTEGSPLDANITNATNGKSTLSYGIQVAYHINGKWTIQSGIHQQEIQYSNNNIAAFSSRRNATSSVNFSSSNANSLDVVTSQNSGLESNSLTNAISNGGTLTQSYGYIEIPVEVKYSFFSKKNFSSELVTGFSSLFLNGNEVSLISDNEVKNGSSTNLNNFNFSGNLGLDFHYLFKTNWSLHLNPMIKIQLNTFSANSNNFAPYNLGIYTSVRYRF